MGTTTQYCFSYLFTLVCQGISQLERPKFLFKYFKNLQSAVNKLGFAQNPQNYLMNKGISKKRSLKDTTTGSYARIHTQRSRQANSYLQTNRPTYLQTKAKQQVYPNSFHQFDQDFRAGRRQLGPKYELQSLCKSLQSHSKQGDLLIPDNRKRKLKQSYPATNPILEEPVYRSLSRQRLWNTQRRNRDNGMYTKLTFQWKY